MKYKLVANRAVDDRSGIEALYEGVIAKIRDRQNQIAAHLERYQEYRNVTREVMSSLASLPQLAYVDHPFLDLSKHVNQKKTEQGIHYINNPEKFPWNKNTYYRFSEEPSAKYVFKLYNSRDEKFDSIYFSSDYRAIIKRPSIKDMLVKSLRHDGSIDSAEVKIKLQEDLAEYGYIDPLIMESIDTALSTLPTNDQRWEGLFILLENDADLVIAHSALAIRTLREQKQADKNVETLNQSEVKEIVNSTRDQKKGSVTVWERLFG